MAITGIQDFYYNVETMDRAVAFYSGVLGCKVVDTSPWWTTLDCFGVRLGLHGAGPHGKPVPPIPKDAHGAHAGGTLTLRSTNLDEDLKSLQRAGVVILGRSDEAWGKLIVFEDTEGNVLKLMSPA